ncbi:MAG TPA: preprotein translocase subunit SecG [Candidatus Deferrimicrobiaceae bacterium]|jgi:preprotein translocase subunit SecG
MPSFIYPIVVTFHVIVSIALILIILLQTGKGADIGAVFGGGSSNTLFGSSGPTSFLSRLTAGAAVIFMFTSLFLAYSTGNRPSSSLMKGAVPMRQQMPQGMPGGMPPGAAGGQPGGPVPNPFQKGGAAPSAPAQPAGTPAPAAPAK